MNAHAFTEVTELAGQQALFRELVRSAFAARPGDVTLAYEFHRGWNGGWKCRAKLPGQRPRGCRFSCEQRAERLTADSNRFKRTGTDTAWHTDQSATIRM